MVKHKRQHYIPISYLEAWRDQNMPPGQTPYVWRFARDGIEYRKKSPQKLFYETDLYTIEARLGNRNLQLEEYLSRVESAFTLLRTHKLQKKLPLTTQDRLILCTFVAVMYSRTKIRARLISDLGKQALNLVDEIQAGISETSPKTEEYLIEIMSHPLSDGKNLLSIDQVRKLTDKPLQETLFPSVHNLTPLLCNKPFFILETQDDIGFITSDNPCVWYDPPNYRNPNQDNTDGVISPTLQITLALSPRHMVFFNSKLKNSGHYVQIERSTLNILNKRTRYFSDKYFISNSDSISPYWFIEQ